MSENPEYTPEKIEQVCAIPFRRPPGQPVELCVITSIKKKRWIFPKGIIDAGETREQTALKEAYEEAGLRGEIWPEPLGQFDDFKWGAHLTVTVVMMEVTSVDVTWPEARIRRRRWVTPEMAIEMLARAELKSLTADAINRIQA
jgi:8-oxo-dGTP pyrophosphatase MutT (NUDIX family)